MSRGFVKEDDQEEIPIVPPRADLPEGVTNYVTQVGMNELLTEKQMLVNEKSNQDNSNDDEKRIALNHINAKLHLLNNRIVTAKIVNINEQAHDEIRFGALVTLKMEANKNIQTNWNDMDIKTCALIHTHTLCTWILLFLCFCFCLVVPFAFFFFFLLSLF